ncbi:MAG: YdeI/OmpD-associated family protein [Rickettsiales bacterium]|nr:YdeI/OmpD-associated family protein [Rickettsiales bacterium]
MNQETIDFGSRGEWRTWLLENCRKSRGVWLVFYRKSETTGPVRLRYAEARDEALCFGWIDSMVRRMDDLRIRHYFSPRRERSLWSKFNKNKIEELIEQNLMTEWGLETIKKAKSNGSYFTLDPVEDLYLPPDLAEALARDARAEAIFEKLARSRKKVLLYQLIILKTPEGRGRKIKLLLEDLLRNQKL